MEPTISFLVLEKADDLGLTVNTNLTAVTGPLFASGSSLWTARSLMSVAR